MKGVKVRGRPVLVFFVDALATETGKKQTDFIYLPTAFPICEHS